MIVESLWAICGQRGRRERGGEKNGEGGGGGRDMEREKIVGEEEGDEKREDTVGIRG